MMNEENIGRIYKIINSVNDKSYIGSTILPLKIRMQKHLIKSKLYPDIKLYKCMNKLGHDKFKMILLKKVKIKNSEELKKIEQNYIDSIKPELNTYCSYVK